MGESETYDLFQKGRQHLERGMAAQATVSLEKAKRREPEKASIREALGIAYFRLRRYREAEEEFRAMLDLAPPTTTRTTGSPARSRSSGGRARRAAT